MKKDLYYIAGSFIAISIVHGGPGPNCFSELLFNQLVDAPKIYRVDDICDPTIKDKVKEVKLDNKQL